MKPNFYLMNWCIRSLINTKLLLYCFILIGVSLFLTQEKVYSQVPTNCRFFDGTYERFRGDSLFPDWDSVAYKKVDVFYKPNGTGLIVSLDFKVGQGQVNNSNNYTDNFWIGVNNSSMLEFARIDIVLKLIKRLECPENFSDTLTITILQRTPCWKARYCRIPVDTLMCCNPDGPTLLSDSNNYIPAHGHLPGYEEIHQGGEYTDEFGNKYFYINAGKSQCGWKCCELKYKFLCKYTVPEFPQFSTIYKEFVGFERKEFENSSCIEDFEYSNPNCPHPENFNPNNPCKGDCNENLFE